MTVDEKALDDAIERVRQLFDSDPYLKTSDAALGPRDGIRYCDLYALWLESMND